MPSAMLWAKRSLHRHAKKEAKEAAEKGQLAGEDAQPNTEAGIMAAAGAQEPPSPLRRTHSDLQVAIVKPSSSLRNHHYVTR